MDRLTLNASIRCLHAVRLFRASAILSATLSLFGGCAPTMAGAGDGRSGGGKGETLDDLNIDYKVVPAPWIDGTLSVEVDQNNTRFWAGQRVRLQNRGDVSGTETESQTTQGDEEWVIPYAFEISPNGDMSKDQKACLRFTVTEHCTREDPASVSLSLFQKKGGSAELEAAEKRWDAARKELNRLLEAARKTYRAENKGTAVSCRNCYTPDEEIFAAEREQDEAKSEYQEALSSNRGDDDYELVEESSNPAPGSGEWTAVLPRHGSPTQREDRSLLQEVGYESARPPEVCVGAGNYLLVLTVRWRSDEALAEADPSTTGPLLGNPADRLRGGLFNFNTKEQGVVLSGWCHGVNQGCPDRTDLYQEPRFIAVNKDGTPIKRGATDEIDDELGAGSSATSTSLDATGLEADVVQSLYANAECTGLYDITARESGFTQALQYLSTNCLNPSGCVQGRVYLHFGGRAQSIASRALKGLQNQTARTGGVVFIGRSGTSASAASWSQETGTVEYSEATRQLNLEGFQAVTAYLDDLKLNHNADVAPQVFTYVRGQELAMVFVYQVASSAAGTVVAVSIPATYI